MEYLYINSADLTFGTVSDATYTIKVPIFKKKVRLLSFNCPNTLYNIDATNNTLVFVVGSNTYTVSIPPGGYNSSAFLQALQNGMNNAGSPLTFTVTQSNTTFLVTIASTSAFIIRNSQSASTISKIIGFGDSDVTGTVVTGVNVLKLITQTQLLISVSEFGVRYNASSTNNYCTFIVPVNCNSSEYINYNESSYFNQEANIDGINIYNLRITIRDNNNKVVNFNGSNYQMIFKLLD